MPELYLFILATLAVNTALLAFLIWAYHSPRFAARRIGGGPPMRVTWRHRSRTMSITSLLSLVTIFGVVYVFHDRLFHARSVSWWTILGETLAIILVYDFIYYFAHRVMHHPKLLRAVHGVHHRARNPSALESFYQHPAELLTGLTLLFGSIWLLGPVHEYTFVATFFIYSNINIIVHAGFTSGSKWFMPFDFLVRKHHLHHAEDPQKNYSTMTPLPDWIFGTARL